MKNKKITILRDIFEKGYWYVLHFTWANQKLLLEKSNVTYISQMVRAIPFGKLSKCGLCFDAIQFFHSFWSDQRIWID